jgi:hypothetical protein
MQFLSYLLVAQTFQGASDMAAPVLSTRSHLKRKRAQVSYYEGTSDEGDSDESSSSVEDCVPRKVQFSGGRLLAANSILTTSAEAQTHLQRCLEQAASQAENISFRLSSSRTQEHHLRPRTHRPERHLPRLPAQALPALREMRPPQCH